MSAAHWVRGADLPPGLQAEVKRQFVHRMTVENVRIFPSYARHQLAGGYRCAILTDAKWLEVTWFAVKRDLSALDFRVHHCQGTCGTVISAELARAQIMAAIRGEAIPQPPTPDTDRVGVRV